MEKMCVSRLVKGQGGFDGILGVRGLINSNTSSYVRVDIERDKMIGQNLCGEQFAVVVAVSDAVIAAGTPSAVSAAI